MHWHRCQEGGVWPLFFDSDSMKRRALRKEGELFGKEKGGEEEGSQIF